MMGLTFQDILERISEESSLDVEELKTRIKEKVSRLNGLISQEGAAHIVANELGINLADSLQRKGIKIDRLAAGMRVLNVVGKVTVNFGVHAFQRDGSERHVGTFVMGDETGTVKVVVWDEPLIQQVFTVLKNGDVVKVEHALVRENNGMLEMHLGNQGKLTLNPAGVSIEAVKQQDSFVMKRINQLKAGDMSVGVFGTIVDLFMPRFFMSCTECNKKIVGETCEVHNLPGVLGIVANCVIDDGTENIRVVAFREQALALLGLQSIDERLKDPSFFDTLKKSVIGKQVVVNGRVVKNEVTDMLELVSRGVKEGSVEQFAQLVMAAGN